METFTIVFYGWLIYYIILLLVQSYRYAQQWDTNPSKIYYFCECLLFIALWIIVPGILMFMVLMLCFVGCDSYIPVVQVIIIWLAFISVNVYPYSVVQKSKETLITLNASLVAKVTIVLAVVIFIGNTFIF